MYELIINKLTKETVSDWRQIGAVIAQLSETARVASDGRTWIDVVSEHLEMIGQQVSKGHLHKVRRAYDFLIEGMDRLDIPHERQGLAKVSSIETAERLYQHNTEAGLKALAACLDPIHPATLTQVQKMLNEYISAHPESKNPLQAAWEKRRKTGVQEIARPLPKLLPTATSQDFNSLARQMSEYVRSVEQDLENQKQKVSSLQEDLVETERALQQAEQELVLTREEEARLRQENLKLQHHG